MRKSDFRSVIQPEFDELASTGMFPVHHIFGGIRNRKKCEKYGFLVCIHPTIHDEAHRNGNDGAGLYFKKQAQAYYEQHIGSREDFIHEFGKNYL